MRPFETLERVTIPDGGELTLHRRDRDFFINLDGEELMSSRAPRSESALAELGCGHLASSERPRVLIGGLGLGFTLRAALEVLPRKAAVTVAEIFPSVVDWHRRHLAALSGRALGDRRVRVEAEDVWTLLGDREPLTYDAILLDVDNGPAVWCLRGNGRLYQRQGLLRLQRALRPAGVLAVWSANADARFLDRLRRAGFATSAETVRSMGAKGRRHTIFVARASKLRSRRRAADGVAPRGRRR